MAVVEYTTGYELEREVAAGRPTLVAGVDEVGRGAWAGPVVVCAAVVEPGFPAPPAGLTDSKRLTAKRRAELAAELPGWVAGYAIGSASHEEIDALGMTAALRLAARAALSQLPERPGAVLLDGKHDYIGSPWLVRTAVKADLRSVSVAAASVLAKVYRDTLMAELGETCPDFAFADNAGYPARPTSRPWPRRARPRTTACRGLTWTTSRNGVTCASTARRSRASSPCCSRWLDDAFKARQGKARRAGRRGVGRRMGISCIGFRYIGCRYRVGSCRSETRRRQATKPGWPGSGGTPGRPR